jgi:hypothetical protein
MSEVNWELIVHRLDTIVKGQDEFKTQLKEIGDEVGKINAIKEGVDILKEWKKEVDEVMPIRDMESIVEWKKKLDEVVSPTQLKELIIEVEKLKSFKIKATMLWVVIQAIVFFLYYLFLPFTIVKK